MSSIPLFSGEQADFPAWRNAVINHADTLLPNHRAVSAIVTAEEWLTIDGVDGPFVRAPLAGAMPDGRVEFNGWTIVDQERKKEDAAFAILKPAIIEKLGPATDVVLEGASNFLAIGSSLIMQRMVLHYGTLSVSDLLNNEAKLEVPMASSDSARALGARHRAIHALAAANGQGISQLNKVRYLRTAVGHLQRYDAAIQTFHNANPAAAAQTFDRLLNALVEADNNPARGSIVAGGFAAAAVAPPPPRGQRCLVHDDATHDSADCFAIKKLREQLKTKPKNNRTVS
jgi:hypothetical protein